MYRLIPYVQMIFFLKPYVIISYCDWNETGKIHCGSGMYLALRKMFKWNIRHVCVPLSLILYLSLSLVQSQKCLSFQQKLKTTAIGEK